MPFNKPLLRDVYKFLFETHPEAHKQGHWFQGELDIPVIDNEKLITDWDSSTCGSTGCIAGWGALMAGYHQERKVDYQRKVDENGNMIPIRSNWMSSVIVAYEPDYSKPVTVGTDRVVDEQGNEYSMQEAARIAFGFDYEQADTMFAGSRSRKQLKAIFEAIEDWPDDQPSESLDFYDVIEGIPNHHEWDEEEQAEAV